MLDKKQYPVRKKRERFTPEPFRYFWNPLWLLELAIGFTFRHLEGASWFAWAAGLFMLYVGYWWNQWQGVVVLSLPILAFVLMAKLGKFGLVIAIILSGLVLYGLGYIN